MRTWRNWYTRQLEVLIPNGLEVRVLSCAPNYCGVEESGRPRHPHKVEIAGSNPAPAPGLYCQIRGCGGIGRHTGFRFQRRKA